MKSLRKKFTTPSLSRGFTLIELLVVIAIISILVAISSVSYQRAVKLSRDSKRKTDLEQLRQALETYRSENYVYPTTAQGIAKLQTDGFITTIPTDPNSPTKKYYYIRNSTTTYSLCAALEVAPGSPDTCGGGTKCTVACNYKTTQP